ncbi:MAG: response regulator [Pseudomonadota bacterium]
MFKLLLVTPNKEALARLASGLAEREDVQVSWAESGSQALNIASETSIALVVTDEKLGDMTGLQLAERLLMLNPVINCAAVSPLSPEDFHRASEGLGLMAQLPPRPGEEEGTYLVERLKHIKGLETSI